MIHGLDETSAKQEWKVQCNRNLGCPIQKCNDSGDHYSWEGGLESIQCKLKVTVPFQNIFSLKIPCLIQFSKKKPGTVGRHVVFLPQKPSFLHIQKKNPGLEWPMLSMVTCEKPKGHSDGSYGILSGGKATQIKGWSSMYHASLRLGWVL